MVDPAPHLYRRGGAEVGVPAPVVQSAISQFERNELAGTGPILTLGHLSRLSEASVPFLRKVVKREIDPYTDLRKPKRDGTFRAIAMPDPLIMGVQRVILRRALRNLDLHPRSFAYREGRSAVDCARLHLGASWLIKLDLHSFFPSISERRIYPVFLGQGYSRLVAFELTRICTRQDLASVRQDLVVRGTKERYPQIPEYAVELLGTLPQGAPTSGALANAIATPLDRSLFELAAEQGMVYTRYSDDLTFSVRGDFSRDRAGSFVGRVIREVAAQGFAVHHKKTKVVPPRARHIVLGLVLGESRLRLRPEFRRHVEGHIAGARGRGLVEHATRRGFESHLGFIAHVEGCLAYAAGVEPDWRAKRQGDWIGALRSSGFPVIVPP